MTAAAAPDNQRVSGARNAVGPETGRVCLRLLDSFELERDGHPVLVPFASQKLIAFLALRGEFVRRTFLAGSLWPDTTDDRAHRCLRSALWRIRSLDVPLLEATPSRVRILPSVVVDIREQIESAHRALDGSCPSGRQDFTALGGDLLPDWYDDWVVFERERLRQLRLHALEASAERLLGDGRFADAVETLHAALRAEPLRESSHRILVETYLAEGNRGEALRHYREYRERLERGLGLQPGPELERLVQQLTPSRRAGRLVTER